MVAKDIRVEGLLQDGADSVWESLHNGADPVNLIASDNEPYQLIRLVGIAKDGNRSKYATYSDLWCELIEGGWRYLRSRWEGHPQTDVREASGKLFDAIDRDTAGLAVLHMANAYHDKVDGVRTGVPAAVIVHQHIMDGDDDLETFCQDYGLDSGDFAMSCAAYSLLERWSELGLDKNKHVVPGLLSADLSNYISDADIFVARKVWLIEALRTAVLGGTAVKGVMEEAADILYSSRRSDNA